MIPGEDDRVQVGVLLLWPERLRVLVDVGNWYCNRHLAERDVRAHRPTCDFASQTLGERPRPCNCWSLERRPIRPDNTSPMAGHGQ